MQGPYSEYRPVLPVFPEQKAAQVPRHAKDVAQQRQPGGLGDFGGGPNGRRSQRRYGFNLPDGCGDLATNQVPAADEVNSFPHLGQFVR